VISIVSDVLVEVSGLLLSEIVDTFRGRPRLLDGSGLGSATSPSAVEFLGAALELLLLLTPVPPPLPLVDALVNPFDLDDDDAVEPLPPTLFVGPFDLDDDEVEPLPLSLVYALVDPFDLDDNEVEPLSLPLVDRSPTATINTAITPRELPTTQNLSCWGIGYLEL